METAINTRTYNGGRFDPMDFSRMTFEPPNVIVHLYLFIGKWLTHVWCSRHDFVSIRHLETNGQQRLLPLSHVVFHWHYT